MIEHEHHLQLTSDSCGAGAVVNTLKRFGIEANEVYVMREVGTNDKEGTEFSRIQEFFTGLMFPTELKQFATYEELMDDSERGEIIVAMTPFWGGEPGGHYTLLDGILEDMICFEDTGVTEDCCPITMDRTEFESKWVCPGYPKSYLLIKPKA